MYVRILNQICIRSLGIFKQTMIHKKLGMDKDYLATKAIPFLFPLAVEPGLNLSQVTVLTHLQHTKILSNCEQAPAEPETKRLLSEFFCFALAGSLGVGKVIRCNSGKAREKPKNVTVGKRGKVKTCKRWTI